LAKKPPLIFRYICPLTFEGKQTGSTIHLNFKQEALRFFDPDSTLAIGD
jgi:hypothetical protein